MDESMPCTRSAVVADLESLVDMRHRLQSHMKVSAPALFDLAPGWRARKRSFYRACLEEPDRRLVVLCDTGEETILGMGLGSVVENPDLEPARFGAIDDVWVEPQWRRRGLGSKIVADLFRFLDRRGVDRLTLSFAIGNVEAESFWTRMGFQPALVMANGRLGDASSSSVRS